MSVLFTTYLHFIFLSHISSAESQKGVNVVHQCSVENQKGAISNSNSNSNHSNSNSNSIAIAIIAIAS